MRRTLTWIRASISSRGTASIITLDVLRRGEVRLLTYQPEPGRTSTAPNSSRASSASRTVDLLVSQILASSRSLGSRSPGLR